MAYVYCVTNIVNGKKYIGSSNKSQIDKSYYGGGFIIKRALKKYGAENFVRQILWQGKSNVCDMEAYWLHYFNVADNPLFYNIASDARGNTLHKSSTKQTISEKLTGRKLTKLTRQRISEAKTGRSTRKKGTLDGPKPGTSEAHKGRVSPNKGKGKKINLFKIDGTHLSVHNNSVELGKYLNVNAETVRQCLVGIQKTICNKQYYVRYQ